MCSRIRSAFSVTWVSWRWRRLLSARSRKLSMVDLPDLQIGGVVVARVAYFLRGTDGPVFVAGHGHLLDLGEGNLGLVLERLGVLVLRQAPLVVRRPESPVLTPDDEAMAPSPAPGSHLLVKLDRQAQFRVRLVVGQVSRLLAGQFQYGHAVSPAVSVVPAAGLLISRLAGATCWPLAAHSVSKHSSAGLSRWKPPYVPSRRSRTVHSGPSPSGSTSPLMQSMATVWVPVSMRIAVRPGSSIVMAWPAGGILMVLSPAGIRMATGLPLRLISADSPCWASSRRSRKVRRASSLPSCFMPLGYHDPYRSQALTGQPLMPPAAAVADHPRSLTAGIPSRNSSYSSWTGHHTRPLTGIPDSERQPVTGGGSHGGQYSAVSGITFPAPVVPTTTVRR